MTVPVEGYATHSATSELVPFSFERRDPRPNDVVIDILYCGICHSDIHFARNEWGRTEYPFVPGHEIIGRVASVGSAISRYKPGDLVISGFDCSMILERELEKDGIKVLREKVGDVFVANRVKNESAVLGVERSGHFFLPEFQYSDDPFAMSLAIGEIISQGEKLSRLADEIPDYPYKQKSIRLREDPAAVMLRLKDALAREEPDTTDGLKITTDGYSILIRPSNTEPILRLYIETIGTDMKELEARYEQIIHKAMSS